LEAGRWKPETPRRSLLGAFASVGLAPIVGRSAQASPKRGGTLTVLIDPEPPVLLTLANSAGVSLFTSSKANEGLLTYDFDLKRLPRCSTQRLPTAR
jgi:peptide/nickel transport system substrate-binding protein